MQKVTIIAVGSLKEPYLKSAAEEYIKRLSKFCRAEVIEIPPARLPERPTKGEIQQALSEEAQKILAKIPQGSAKVALCIEGEMLSSEALAARIQQYSQVASSVSFIIGGSFGLDDSVKSSCDLRLSFSRMTFPHQMFRIMLMEQIYRAYSISAGLPYHK